MGSRMVGQKEKNKQKKGMGEKTMKTKKKKDP